MLVHVYPSKISLKVNDVLSHVIQITWGNIRFKERAHCCYEGPQGGKILREKKKHS